MVKWYRVYKVTCNYVSVLKCNHAITLADENARLRFTVVKWCRSAMVAWYRDSVVSNCHSSSAPETIRACGRAGS